MGQPERKMGKMGQPELRDFLESPGRLVAQLALLAWQT